MISGDRSWDAYANHRGLVLGPSQHLLRVFLELEARDFMS